EDQEQGYGLHEPDAGAGVLIAAHRVFLRSNPIDLALLIASVGLDLGHHAAIQCSDRRTRATFVAILGVFRRSPIHSWRRGLNPPGYATLLGWRRRCGWRESGRLF